MSDEQAVRRAVSIHSDYQIGDRVKAPNDERGVVIALVVHDDVCAHYRVRWADGSDSWMVGSDLCRTRHAAQPLDKVRATRQDGPL